VEQNPYEPPKADIGAGASSSGSGLAAGQLLPPDVEAKAMELLGRKRSSAGGISFAVAWAVCTPTLLLVTGVLLALIIGGTLAGAISKLWVQSRTQAYVTQVSQELGIPAGAFRPERYLI
jgi:uncharacterized membrane protein